jgi:hypothetical protein
MAPLGASLHQATLIVLAALVAVLVAQVDLDPRDAITRTDQGTLNKTYDPRRQRFIALNGVIGVDLNLQQRAPIVIVQYLVTRLCDRK